VAPAAVIDIAAVDIRHQAVQTTTPLRLLASKRFESMLLGPGARALVDEPKDDAMH
jgi:hypothetical protein